LNGRRLASSILGRVRTLDLDPGTCAMSAWLLPATSHLLATFC